MRTSRRPEGSYICDAQYSPAQYLQDYLLPEHRLQVPTHSRTRSR